ncbi:hypothetical protein D3C85_1024230 [compost metagenome]
MPRPQGCGHIDQRFQSPADSQPDHDGQHQTSQDIGPQRMAYDPVDQIGPDVVSLAHPDAQVVLFVFEQKPAPMPVVQVYYIAEARCCRRCSEGRCTGRVYQYLALEVPDLKGNLGFIGMPVDPGLRLAQGPIESLIQISMFFARQGHAHDALQQASVLGQLGIIDFGNFVIAVVQIEHADHRQTGEHKANDQGQGATPDRGHRRSSTR